MIDGSHTSPSCTRPSKVLKKLIIWSPLSSFTKRPMSWRLRNLKSKGSTSVPPQDWDHKRPQTSIRLSHETSLADCRRFGKTTSSSSLVSSRLCTDESVSCNSYISSVRALKDMITCSHSTFLCDNVMLIFENLRVSFAMIRSSVESTRQFQIQQDKL